MSTVFKKKLIEDLDKHKASKSRGARLTNKAVAQEAVNTVKKIGLEVSVYSAHCLCPELINFQIENLYERSGMYGFALFSKGHIHDKTMPFVVQSKGAANFLRESLGVDPMDALAKFEQWCCARDGGTFNHHNLTEFQSSDTKYQVL